MSEIRMKMAHQNHAGKPSFLHGGLVWLPTRRRIPSVEDPTIVLQNCQQEEEGPIPQGLRHLRFWDPPLLPQNRPRGCAVQKEAMDGSRSREDDVQR